MIIIVAITVEPKETAPDEAPPWNSEDAESVIGRLRDVLFGVTKYDDQIAWQVRGLTIRGVS